MRVLLGIVIVIVGVLVVVVGVLYVTVPAHSLPTYVPGYVARAVGAHAAGKLTRRGIVAVVVGGALVVAGAAVAMTGRRRARW